MNLLLDTHVFIWWDSSSARLTPAALAALRDPANLLFVSAASVWEMVIKAQLGKLSLRLPLRDILTHQQTNGITLLPVTSSHALAVEALPSVHKDPFDRLLIAQANVEAYVMVSADHVFTQYPVRLLW